MVLPFLVPHIRYVHSWMAQDYRVHYHARGTGHDAVALGWVYLNRFRLRLRACIQTKQPVLVHLGVYMHLQVSLLLSQELREPIPRAEGLGESPVGTAGHLVEGGVAIVPSG